MSTLATMETTTKAVRSIFILRWSRRERTNDGIVPQRATIDRARYVWLRPGRSCLSRRRRRLLFGSLIKQWHWVGRLEDALCSVSRGLGLRRSSNSLCQTSSSSSRTEGGTRTPTRVRRLRSNSSRVARTQVVYWGG